MPQVDREIVELRGYVVRRPRVTDAMGMVLRHAYGEAPTVPGDVEALLRKLDRLH